MIDPGECIDCALCVPECPVNAIDAQEDVPAAQQDSALMYAANAIAAFDEFSAKAPI